MEFSALVSVVSNDEKGLKQGEIFKYDRTYRSGGGLFLSVGSTTSSGYTKVSEFDFTHFSSKNVGSFNISVNHTLAVEVDQAFEHLLNIFSDEVLGEVSELFDDPFEGAVLDIPLKT